MNVCRVKLLPIYVAVLLLLNVEMFFSAINTVAGVPLKQRKM